MSLATTEQPEVISNASGPIGIRIHGTTHPITERLSAKHEASQLRQQLDAVRGAGALAIAIADLQRVAHGRLGKSDSQVVRRLLGHIDDAEAQAWAQLGALVTPDDSPRIPRLD